MRAADRAGPQGVNTYTELDGPMRLLPIKGAAERSADREQFLLSANDRRLTTTTKAMRGSNTVSSSSSLSLKRRRKEERNKNKRRRRAAESLPFFDCASLVGLDSRTVHTLYAGSFVVYLINVTGDWVHTVHACRGSTVAFPLKSWCALLMVVSCVVGSTLTFLLTHLCFEHALRRRPRRHSQPTNTTCWHYGCLAFKQWLMSFDCFRVSLLISLLQDTPISVVNYWWLGGCMTTNPRQPFWPIAFSSLSTVLSCLWRCVVLFYGGRQLRRFFKATREESRPDHLVTAFPGSVDHSGGTTSTTASAGSKKMNNVGAEAVANCKLARVTWRTSVLYVLLACLPCTLGRRRAFCNAVNQDGKRTLRRLAANCTLLCQGAVMVASLAAALFLLTINVIWLQSALLLGTDLRSVEHVSRICLKVEPHRRAVRWMLSTADWPQAPPWRCKPLFEAGQLAPGPVHWKRQPCPRWQLTQPPAWVLVHRAGAELVTIWTQVTVADQANETTTIWFDMLIKNSTSCGRTEEMGWSIVSSQRDALEQGRRRLCLGCHCAFATRRLDKLLCDS